jgi:hypothetical protein
MRDKPILSPERMLYQGNDRRGSVAKKISGRESQGARLQDELIGWQPHHHLWADCLEKMWEPRRLTTLWASTACYSDSFIHKFAGKQNIWTDTRIPPLLWAFPLFNESIWTIATFTNYCQVNKALSHISDRQQYVCHPVAVLNDMCFSAYLDR